MNGSCTRADAPLPTRFGGFTALNRVTLHVKAGDTVKVHVKVREAGKERRQRRGCQQPAQCPLAGHQ